MALLYYRLCNDILPRKILILSSLVSLYNKYEVYIHFTYRSFYIVYDNYSSLDLIALRYIVLLLLSGCFLQDDYRKETTI